MQSLATLTADLGEVIGEIRPLNGINMGPWSCSGFLDLSAHHREMGFSHTRTHDANYAVPGAIDIHCIFPLFHADPDNPANYTFAISDDYVQSILNVGSQVYYRLGETIEHHRARKYYAHPPGDYDKWARICVNIVRHYNQGWADGFHHGIRYWEVWNEPHHPPCWTGTAEDYYRLYETTARAIKTHDPNLKVGGPASGDWDGILNDAFGRGFLDYVRARNVPLDFYSWHAYPDSPAKIVARALAARKYLDNLGLTGVESHLNEWAFNPLGWACMSDFANSGPGAFELSTGPHGAAFIASVLALLQDVPIDQTHYYWGREGFWGPVDFYSRPLANFYAFKAFKVMLDTAPRRIAATGSDVATGLAVLGGVSRDGKSATILVSNFSHAADAVDLTISRWSWSGQAACDIALIDGEHSLQVVRRETLVSGGTIRVPLPTGTVGLLTIQPTDG